MAVTSSAQAATGNRRQWRDERTAATGRRRGPERPGWIYLGNYEQAPEDVRREALFHEYTYALQEWQAEVRFQSQDREERSFVPRWMVEGCAQYLAIKAGARRGFVDEGHRRGLHRGVARVRAPGHDPRRGRGGPSLLLAMAQHRDWKKAFADAFGATPADLYCAFEAYRATL